MRKGLTLMEITIVLAIMAIVAMILVPLFLRTTDRAKLRADIQSVRVVQNAIDLYRTENRRPVKGTPNIDEMIKYLSEPEVGYISPRHDSLQTAGAEWFRENNGDIKVDIRKSPEEVQLAYESLPEDEQGYIKK
jgi:prepilin-type N-terminal cleavage/methylation domain-containing protein